MPVVRTTRSDAGGDEERVGGGSGTSEVSYRDKTTGRTVRLRESPTSFLVVAAATDAESMQPVVNQRSFRVRRSSEDDQVFLLDLASDSESTSAVRRTVAELEADDRIEAVAPGLVDADGLVRHAYPGRVVVQFQDVPHSRAVRYLTSLGSRVTRRFRSAGLYEAAVPPGQDVPGFIDQLNSSDQVAFAEPSFYGFDDAEVRFRAWVGDTAASPATETGQPTSGTPPNGYEAETSLSWNLDRIALRDAWRATQGSAGVIVAVVDYLPEESHEAIVSQLAVPISDDLIYCAAPVVNPHGTGILSVVAGKSSSFTGIAPGIRLLPLVVNLSSQIYAERADAIRAAARMAREQRVGNLQFSRLVLSCSWRTRGDITVVRQALAEAVAAGVLVVFSAGNEGSGQAHYPSDYATWPGTLGDGVIAVAATDQDDVKAPYSNYSASVGITAPGGDGDPIDQRDVPCADLGNSYGYMAGTSVAAPHVAAVAALILSVDPTLTPREVKQLILQTADPINDRNPGYQNLLGAGRLNASRAVAAARARTQPATTQPATTSESQETTRPPSSGPRFAAWAGRA